MVEWLECVLGWLLNPITLALMCITVVGGLIELVRDD